MKGYRYAVIGLGQFGMSIAKMLANKGAEVLAIDNSENHIEQIKDLVAYAVTLDATNPKALEAQGLDEMDAVVVTIGEDFEALILTTAHLLDLKIKRILVRANGAQQRVILEKMGITEVLLPEEEVSRVVVERLLNPSILSLLELPDEYEVVEIKPPKSAIGRSLGDLKLRDKYKLNLITIKRNYSADDASSPAESHVLGVPGSQTILQPTDTLVVFGITKDIERFLDIN